MKSGFIPVLATCSMMALASCTQSTAPLIDTPHGVFKGSIVMYDSTGGNPVNGTLSVTRGDSTNLSGNWTLGKGQSGTLSGDMPDSTLWLNFNPNMIDANTFLLGTFDGKHIKGRWVYSGIAGPINHGTFVATSN